MTASIYIIPSAMERFRLHAQVNLDTPHDTLCRRIVASIWQARSVSTNEIEQRVYRGEQQEIIPLPQFGVSAVVQPNRYEGGSDEVVVTFFEIEISKEGDAILLFLSPSGDWRWIRCEPEEVAEKRSRLVHAGVDDDEIEVFYRR